MTRRISISLPVALTGSIALLLSPAQASDVGRHGEGVPSEVSKAAGEAIKAMKFDAGLKVTLFAAEPLLGNGVAFYPDEKGRWFISESFRQEHGIEDNRGHMNWLDEDLAATTTDDRLAIINRHYPDEKKRADRFTSREERISIVEDSNGDGLADKTQIFADGFRDPLDGTAAGILVRNGQVWWTNIPNLWRFNVGADGRAASREKAFSGFGVKWAFRGHDMHGLRFGPDGRLYWSIGDRGINVTSREGKNFAYTDRGTVMRCEPDGSNFEIFAQGLRNPQELAFNELGDLFTGDNNSDGGDKARFVHVCEGGDSGWRIGYQYLNDRGPWNRERMWDEKQAPAVASIVPPIANIADGPSGLTYSPGGALSAKYQGKFFLSDFRGGASASKVHEIALEQAGAGWKVKDRRDFVRGVLTTDVEFGPDGALYVLDWVEGWSGVGKGRIYRFADTAADAKLLAETQALIADGLAAKPEPELIALLAHADQRVRQTAQFELASRKSLAALTAAAQPGKPPLSRLHAIWALGQLARRDGSGIPALLPLLGDADGEVRAQSAKVLGDAKAPAAAGALMKQLKDAAPRARYHAALALGKIGHAAALEPLIELAAETAGNDPILRHAAIAGLAGCATPAALAERGEKDARPAVRLAVVVALRQHRSELLKNFLRDAEAAIALEAARAIYDLPVDAALPQLAALAGDAALKHPELIRRAVNAAYRLGGAENAKRIAQFAARADAPRAVRADAVAALSAWEKPNGKDRITYAWRPLPARPVAEATGALTPHIAALLADAGTQEVAAAAVGKLALAEAAPALVQLAKADSAAPVARIAAIEALVQLKHPSVSEAARAAITAKDAKIRAAALTALAARDPDSAVKFIADTIKSGEVRERQAAVMALTQISSPAAKTQIALLMDELIAGKAAPEIQLEIYEAAKKVGLNDKTGQYKANLSQNDPLANFRLSFAGGDVEKGRKIFREKAEVQCLRCHKAEIGDSQVGPDLTKIGAAKDRNYLIESILFPSRHIADGFGIVSLTLKQGAPVAGRLLKEDAAALVVETADDKGQPKTVTIPAAEVTQRINAPSPMPENIRDQLSRAELRDLIEYLVTRK